MSEPGWLRDEGGGVRLELLVQPRASRTRVLGEHDGRLKIQLAAPPVDGEANAELLRFLADRLEVPRRAIELRGGEASRRKSLHVAGVTAPVALARLRPAAP